MPLAVGTYFGRNSTRQAYTPFAGDGGALNPFRCAAIGRESSGSFNVFAADVGVGIFDATFVANPTPFKPFGDLVTFRPNPIAFGQLSTLFAPLPFPKVHTALTTAWMEFVAAPGIRVCVISLEVNGSDEYVFALQEELAPLRLNPAFP